MSVLLFKLSMVHLLLIETGGLSFTDIQTEKCYYDGLAPSLFHSTLEKIK